MKHIYGFIPKNRLNVTDEQESFCMAMNGRIRMYMGDKYNAHKHQFDHGPCVTIGMISCPECGKQMEWSMHLNITNGEVSGDIPECCGICLLDIERMKASPLTLENFQDIFGNIVK